MGLRRSADAVGGALVLAGALWASFTTFVEDGDGGPEAVTLFVAVALAYAGSRLVSHLDSALAPLAIVGVGVAVLVVGSPGDVVSSSPLDGPFGYSNATGAFYLQCALGALILAFDRRQPLRLVGSATALVFAAVPVLTQTRAAIALFVLLPLAWVVRSIVGTRAAITMCAAAFAASVVLSLAVAAAYSGADGYDRDAELGGLDRVIDATVSLRRVELQHDALDLMLDHPVTGLGPGQFDDESPAARRDSDSPYAHHGFLQAGAEQGVPGFLLLLGLFAWSFVRVRSSIGRRRRSVVVAVAIAALGAHACVEYVLQFPAIPALTAALLGCAVELHPRWGRPALAEAP